MNWNVANYLGCYVDWIGRIHSFMFSFPSHNKYQINVRTWRRSIPRYARSTVNSQRIRFAWKIPRLALTKRGLEVVHFKTLQRFQICIKQLDSLERICLFEIKVFTMYKTSLHTNSCNQAMKLHYTETRIFCHDSSAVCRQGYQWLRGYGSVFNRRILHACFVCFWCHRFFSCSLFILWSSSYH